MDLLIAVAVGYLLGCSHMSYYIARVKKVDIKSQGSKNYGASNAMALLGWKFGILTGAHDFLKAVLAVSLMRIFYPEEMLLFVAAGAASVLGHIFPFYLKFDGGKGFASFVGMTLALNWKLGLAIIVLGVILTLVTDYIVMATFTTITLVPVATALIYHSILYAAIISCVSLVILWKHRENIKRLKNGTEMKLSKANKKEYSLK